jgi:alkylation response protein AidB-like acyl-CoA dehydrogenase
LNFALDEQQEMLQAMARDFLAAEWPEKVLRAMAADDRGYTPELWRKMAAANLLGLSLPEEYGGVGGFLDLAVVLEEMGAACFLTPFFAAVVLGAGIIMAAGREEQKQRYLPGIAAGEKIVTLAPAEKAGDYTPDGVQMRAVERRGDYVISGRKLFVPDAHVADHIVCATRTSRGITLFIVDINQAGIRVKPQKVISGEKLCTVDFDNVPVDVLGEAGGGWPAVEKVLSRAAVARCAEMAGIARQVLRITLDYAKERTAFGHPIGAFQAIQHRFADMVTDAEGARYVAYQAAWCLDRGLDAEKEVAAARAWVGQACRRVCASAHQVHGAIGFTRDHVLNLYTRKASAAEASFGGSDFFIEKLGEIKSKIRNEKSKTQIKDKK